MSTSEFYFGGLIVILINCLILYVVISAANKTNQKQRFLWAQMLFLSYLAKKSGMPDEEINKIIDATK